MFLVENSFLKLVNRQQQRPLILDLDSRNLCRQEYVENHHLMKQLRRQREIQAIYRYECSNL